MIEIPPAEMPWTAEEEAYWELDEEVQNACSQAARTLLRKAESAAFERFMIYYYVEEPLEFKHYGEATDKTRLAAELTSRDRDLLKRLARAAFVAAASIDPDEGDRTWPEYSGHRPNPHHHLRMLSGLLWAILKEKATEPRQQDASHE
jgi:hypothetical protein